MNDTLLRMDTSIGRISGYLPNAFVMFIIMFAMSWATFAQSVSPKRGGKSGQASSPKNMLRELSPQDLTKHADLIAIGKISAITSSWSEGNKRIITDVNLTVKQYLKGQLQSEVVTISHPGGEVGEIGELYSHTPRFKKDEEVLVFAKKDGKGKFQIVGGERGKYTVATDHRSGKKMISEEITLDDFAARVKGYIRQQLDK